MLQAVGLGKLKPNTLIMGYMHRWQKADVRHVNEYFQIIDDALELNYGIGILRLNCSDNGNGLGTKETKDYSENLEEMEKSCMYN